MFKLLIEVTSIEEAERILACLKHSADPATVARVAGQVGGFDACDMTSASAQGFRDGAQAAATGETAAEKPRNPRGRPRRQVAEPLPESAAPASEPEVTATPEAEAPASEPAQQSSYTLADIRGALQGVQAASPGNLQPVIDLLAKFGVARVSDVKESDYPAFVEACKKAS